MAQTNSQDPNHAGMQKHSTDKEISLLAIIQEDSQLPKKEQQRYQQLWRKCEDQILSEDELIEYQTLLSQLEARNLKRIEALMALAQSRGNTLGKITAEFSLKEKHLPT